MRGRERSHALKGLVVWLCLLEVEKECRTFWVLQNSAEAQVGTIRTARVRIGRAAVMISRARQYRTPRQGCPPRAIIPCRAESHESAAQFSRLRAK